MILVDSNIIIDIIGGDPAWSDWSNAQLAKALQTDGLAINPIIYAELCAHEQTGRHLDAFLTAGNIAVQALSTTCARLAGMAFLQYRKNKGAKSGVLADFFIGAHAQEMQWTILTRDVGRYQTYFPTVKLITPKETP